MRKIYLLLLSFTFITQGLLGQSTKAYEKSAREAFAAKNYCAALEHSETVMARDTSKTDVFGIAAESAYQLRLFKKSQHYFEMMPSGDYSSADVSGRLEELRAINAPYPELDPCIQRVTRVDIYDCLTSKMAPFQWDGKLFYTSSKYDCGSPGPCANSLEIFAFNPETEQSEAIPFPEQNIGQVTFTEDGNRMYYTQCDCVETDSTFSYECKIYYRQKTTDEYGTEKWGPRLTMPESVNRPGFNVTQPRIGRLPGAETDRLYYASNYTGGGARGGMDIWYVDLNEEGSCSVEPVNFGEVNTSGDDITPFYDEHCQNFYFSTNGREDSRGGFDIYKMQMGTYGASIEPLSGRINTVYDEMYYSTASEFVAYYTSNRAELDPNGLEDESCCLKTDIYKVEFKTKVDLEVAVFVEEVDDYGNKTKQPLNGVDLVVKNSYGNVLFSGREEYGNIYKIADLPLGENFTINGTKPGYRPDENAAETAEIYCSCDEIKRELILRPYKIRLVVRTYDLFNYDLGEDLGAEGYQSTEILEPYRRIDLTPGLFSGDKTKEDIRMNELSGVTVNLFDRTSDVPPNTQVNNDSLLFTLDWGHDYDLTGEKSGYISNDLRICFNTDIPLEERTEDVTIYKNLFLFKSLPLYFDNDWPKRKPILDSYGNLQRKANGRVLRQINDTEGIEDRNFWTEYERYRGLEQEYKDKYLETSGNYGVAGCTYPLDSITEFFQKDLFEGMSRLQYIAPAILKYLREGYTITLFIRGTASKLSNPTYNEKLSQRRINSMLKYLAGYDDGQTGENQLAYYIDNGFVNVERDPRGDKLGKAPQTGPFCATWYSHIAAKDRSVSIVNIKTDPPLGEIGKAPCDTDSSDDDD